MGFDFDFIKAFYILKRRFTYFFDKFILFSVESLFENYVRRSIIIKAFVNFLGVVIYFYWQNIIRNIWLILRKQGRKLK